MSEIYSPGSIAGPQGSAGAAGSQGSVSTLASSVLPMSGNLFDANKALMGFAIQSDGTISASANWASSGMIYCAGMTSMVSNLPIDVGDVSFATYDANGNFIATLPSSSFGGAYQPGPNQILGGIAFPLPGTQVYVRFTWFTPRLGSYGSTSDVAMGMVFASTATAALPGSFVSFSWDTASDVGAKDAVVAANAAAALAGSLMVVPRTFAGTVLPGTHGGRRNGFDYLSPIPGILNSNGTISASAGWNTAMVYAPGSTSGITNLPFWAVLQGASVCTYDATGNFLADITSTLIPYTGNGTAPTGHMQVGVVFPLPGNQTFLKFSWNGSFASWQYPGSAASCVFYSGTVADPPPSSLTPLNYSTPFFGNTPVNVKTASQLGASIDFSVDVTHVLNTFLATASATNPIKLILDGMFLTTGLVISPNGYTTIEGTGWGSGVFVLNGSNQDGIRIGAYTSATGNSEGAYNIALPARLATNIILRDFTLDANGAGNTTGPIGCAPINEPVADAPVHGVYGAILANCTNVHVDNVNFKASPTYALCLTNAGFVTVSDCQFISTGTLHDGVHIDGPSSDIGIDNCYFSTGDDSIALNAPEGYGGDISRVTVTNCRFNGSLAVMRIYTSLDTAYMPTNNVHKVRDVAVSNCVGYTYNQCFSLGIFGGGLSATYDVDQVQDLMVSDCTLSSPNSLAVITTPFGKITFRNVNFIPTSAAAVIQSWYPIGELMLDGVTILRNADGSYAPSAWVSSIAGSNIDRLSLLNCRVIDELGTNYAAVPCILDIGGVVGALSMEAVDMRHITALVSVAAGWGNIATLRGGGVMGTGVQVPDSVMDNNALYLSSNAGGAPSIRVGGMVKRVALV
jgi:hypothetical protein